MALHHGCEVFATVGSKQKREYLKQRFPQLTDKSFSNSRYTPFYFVQGSSNVRYKCFLKFAFNGSETECIH